MGGIDSGACLHEIAKTMPQESTYVNVERIVDPEKKITLTVQ